MTDIKTLNDNFRKTFIGGRVMLTSGIRAKTQDEIAEILEKVRNRHIRNDKTKKEYNFIKQIRFTK